MGHTACEGVNSLSRDRGSSLGLVSSQGNEVGLPTFPYATDFLLSFPLYCDMV